MLRMNLSPADIEAFLALAETGSFSQTGRALGLSQPAVSARISHLEQTLGVPLFHRTTRRVTITSAGERLRVRLDRAMTELHGLVEELQDEAHLRRGRLVVGASPTVAAGLVAEAISRFHAAHPDVEVVLQDDFYGHVLDRVAQGEVDLAVIPYEPEDSGFDFELLLTDRFLLAVPQAHRLAGRAELELAEVAEEPLITMPPESAAWTTVKRAFEAAGLTFRPAMQTRNSLTVLTLVRAGYGVALVTDLLTRTLPVPGVALVRVSGVDLSRRVGIVTPRRRAFSPAAVAFCAVLRAVAGAAT